MLTVERLLRLVLPFGCSADVDPVSADFVENDETFQEYWGTVPFWPVDLFAAVALLCKRTGAYVFVKPGLPYTPPDNCPEGLKGRVTTDPFGIFGEDGRARFDLTVTGHVWRHGLTSIDDGSLSGKEKDEFLSSIEKAIDKDSRIEWRTKNEVKKAVNSRIERIRHRSVIENLWRRLVEDHRFELIVEPIGPWEDFDSCPERLSFFSVILKLLIIADEACTGIAQYYDVDDVDGDVEAPWLIRVLNDKLVETYEEFVVAMKFHSQSGLDTNPDFNPPNIPFTYAADDNIAPVFPKARTTSLGCALRSLSRNVALAPMTTEVAGFWHNMSGYESDGLFNLLLIPFPTKMGHDTFIPAFAEEDLSIGIRSRKWRWFDIQQYQSHWLPSPGDDEGRDDLADSLIQIVKSARRLNSNQINGVVLPEAALDYDMFQRFAEKLSSFDEIEVLISGTSNVPLSKLKNKALEIYSDDGTVKHGNFVSTAVFIPKSESKNTSGGRYLVSVQHKHHRWKLDKQQVIDYGAAFRLSPEYDWWENINISRRTLNFWSFRQHSILATLICEDLARTDPAQQVIRSIGPSLLISILMDGPQFKGRWPGLYASSLAQDPGCSVLTLTSLGLMTDRSDGGRFKPSRNIALWADPKNGVRELNLAKDASAMVLNIMGNPCTTHSLDGRYQRESARQWELIGVKDVFVD